MLEMNYPKRGLNKDTKHDIDEYVRTIMDRRDNRNRSWFAAIAVIVVTVLGGAGVLFREYVADALNEAKNQAAQAANIAGRDAVTTDEFRKAVLDMQREASRAASEARTGAEALGQSIAGVKQDLSDAELLLARARATSDQIDKLAKGVTQRLAVGAVASTGTPSAFGGSLTGAVVAFVSVDLAKSCPDGWSQFTAANDRFIVGAGKMFVPSAVGGEVGKGLLVTVHTQQDGRKVSDYNWGSTPWAGGPNPARGDADLTSTTEAVPLPSYIALVYCRKD